MSARERGATSGASGLSGRERGATSGASGLSGREREATSRPIRVLVVDDSAVVRRLVSEALSSAGGIEVAGVAANGRIALVKIAQLRPDVVTLDIEMPEMDGLQALAEIRRQHPGLPVIMFSTLTERGASATLDALALGANDYVAKPSGAGAMHVAIETARAELVPRIRALCGRRGAPALAPPAAAPRPLRREALARVDVVAVGVSTGGPNALGALLPALPADLPVPVVVVQHMPPMFTRLLAERLDGASGLQVGEGSAGMALERGRAWIAPGGRHMLVRRRGVAVELHLTDDPPESSCRPAVDPLFRSVVEVYGAKVLAVVLTGMGSDGVRGCEAVLRGGGQVVAQDEPTSVVWGMPGEVVRAGLAHAVVPLDRMAGEIVRRVAVGRALPAARLPEPA